jgi:hypothetical protein
VGSANETLDQLSGVITNSMTDNTLVFTVKGKRLEVKIGAKTAYQAILAKPDFFRAGAIGPDGFPDVVTGQFWQHSNQNSVAQGLVDAATGGAVKPVDHRTPDGEETRQGPSEFRAIDYAMDLLKFWQTFAFPNDDAKQEALAFIMGYFSHGVGDSFAHTWVNEYAGGAWELGAGIGVFGTFTEEAKHVAIEGLVDSRLPGRLQNADGSVGGELNRMTVRAPILFLDAFFSRARENAAAFGNKDSSSFDEFVKYYRQLDRYYGAAVYNYFNLQVDAAQALKNFSEMGSLVDLAEQWQPGPFLNTLLDIYDFPNQLANELDSWFGGDFLPFITGDYIKCELFTSETTGLEAIRKVWDYLGGFNDRIAHYEERAKVVRINWMRLSECTAQNFVNINGGRFDPMQPTRNRDACTAIADRPFQDEGDARGLYRGSIRGGNDDDDEFLRDLRSYFKGSDDDHDGLLTPEEFIEPRNAHRRLGSNLSRMKAYLLGFAFTLDDLEDVVITDKHESSIDHACSLVRQSSERHCLNAKLLPFALTYKTAECVADLAQCTASAVGDCLSGLCLSACSGTPFTWLGVCDNMCDATESACKSIIGPACDGVPGACIGIAGIGCFERTFIYDECVDLLDDGCEFLAGGDPNCAENIVGCGAEGVVCSAEALELLLLEEGWADEILGPVADVCDTIDEARAFFDRFDTLPERIAFAESNGVPVTQINELMALSERVVDKFAGFPPEYFVNLTFLAEDLRDDPAYALQYKTALENFEKANAGLAPGSEREARDGAAKKLRDWLAAAPTGTGAGSPNPLLNVNTDPTLAQAKKDLLEFEKIVEALVIPPFAGPTARRILGDVGPDFVKSFIPFFNTVQGMKLVPMFSQADITRLFTQETLPTDRLPWNVPGLFSSHCSAGAPTNLYCDVFLSFDDPNCLGAEGHGCRKHEDDLVDPRSPDPDRLGWVVGRGLVVWNDYDGSGVTPPFITTNFPLASSPEAFEKLYTRVFHVPDRAPRFGGFEDPERPWTVDPPGTGKVTDTDRSQGLSSLEVTGCGWIPMRSPHFDTPEFEIIGSKLAVDIKLPTTQTNPSWVGALQMEISIRNAGIYNRNLGQRELTPLARGSWKTLEFDVPTDVQDALLGDHPDAQIVLFFNSSNCAAGTLFDNLRFTGTLRERETFHRSGSTGVDVHTSQLFSFDRLADWSSAETPVSAAPAALVRDGTGAVQVENASGYFVVKSRKFSNADMPSLTSTLSVDLWLSRPMPNEYWYGDVQPMLSCPSRGLWDQPIGYASLSFLHLEDYTQLTFPLSDRVRASLALPFNDCSISFAFSVGLGSGKMVLERMGFVD